ncbi:MAG: carboxylating nicotinate-nucleotide diphosphorylase [Bacteroidetes bacterium]|nr:carboxylating nicotinate-nucleotide diphosphorylase [Bacteroidota bacterium]
MKDVNIFELAETKRFVQQAIDEDRGDGDHTSLACIPADKQAKAKLLVKDDGILAGVALAQLIFSMVDVSIKSEVLIIDGSHIKKGDIVFYAEGPAQSLLLAERLMLNCMQRLSGVATATSKLVKLIEGTKAKLLDTRKTTPGMRLLEKWAVTMGGGVNHRIGLYDMMMIKDNHVDAAGGIKNAIERALLYKKEKNKNDLKIEVETRNMEEVNEVISIGGVNRIMLDNFTPEKMKEAVTLIDGRYETEASGGINEETIRTYAETGVDFISVGAITHSVKALDLSFKVVL